MNTQYEKAVFARLFPRPRKFALSDGFCRLNGSIAVELSGEDSVQKVEEAFVKHWHVNAIVTHNGKTALEDDACRIDILPDVLRIEAGSGHALNYALMTLRQLAEMERGGVGDAHYFFPCCTIEDAPACAFRGIHLCIFPESDPLRIESAIRMAAYCKYNYVVLEPWGVFPFQSHPEVGWSDRMWSRDAFGHLLQVAKACGITLIPQLNLFGHAAFSRVGSAKHAVLDFHPEWEPLYEPGGWSYCLSNMETRRILTDLALELYEFFGNPQFFHIGCDEAYDFQTCAACASADSETLLLNHLTYFRELFAQRNCRVIMWHDMLLMADDPRWKGCIAFGDDRTRGILAKLPRDIVLADWQYGKAPEENPNHEFPTANYLKQCGFDVMLCPFTDEVGIAQIGSQVAKHKHFGVLQTTWHLAYQKDFFRMLAGGAFAAWNGVHEPLSFDDTMHVAFARNLRHVHQDMQITHYAETGHTMHQILTPDYQP